MEFHVARVLVDRPVGTRSVDYDGAVRDVPGLKAGEAAVSRDLVLQNKLEDDIAVELELLFDDDPQQAKTDGDFGLVVHRAAAVDRVGRRIDMT